MRIGVAFHHKGSVARLMAEFRKTALAQQTYREGSATRKPSPTREKARPNLKPAAVVNVHADDAPPTTADSEEVSKHRLNGYYHAHP
jgi:hypothetical protein